MFFIYLTTPGDIQFMNFLYFLDYIAIWSSTANNDLGANFFVVLYTHYFYSSFKVPTAMFWD